MNLDPLHALRSAAAGRGGSKPAGIKIPESFYSPDGGVPVVVGVASISQLTGKLAEYLSPSELKKVREAYRFSDEMHLIPTILLVPII